MADQRRANVNWVVCSVGANPTFDGAQLAVLMDIRDELQGIRALLNCSNCLEIPRTLRAIRANTSRIKKEKS
jgi:hypothetical protein